MGGGAGSRGWRAVCLFLCSEAVEKKGFFLPLQENSIHKHFTGMSGAQMKCGLAELIY